MNAAIPRNPYIISNPTYLSKQNNLQLLRITISEKETKIDFGYQATSYYSRGGWIDISPNTFIRPSGSNTKFILIDATNIPFGPEKLHFNSSIEWRYFSLLFPPLPPAVESFDLIEKEGGDSTEFNFFAINLKEDTKKSLIY